MGRPAIQTDVMRFAKIVLHLSRRQAVASRHVGRVMFCDMGRVNI